MATTKQKAHKLITYYQNNYKNRFGNTPQGFNRFSLSNGFECMIMDYGWDRAVEIVDYYMSTQEVHEPHRLQYKYGTIDVALTDIDQDKQHRENLRIKTIQQIKEKNEQRGS